MLLELPSTIKVEVARLPVNSKVTVEGHPVEGTIFIKEGHKVLDGIVIKHNHRTNIVPWQHDLEGQERMAIFVVCKVWKGLHVRTWA